MKTVEYYTMFAVLETKTPQREVTHAGMPAKRPLDLEEEEDEEENEEYPDPGVWRATQCRAMFEDEGRAKDWATSRFGRNYIIVKMLLNRIMFQKAPSFDTDK